MYHSLLDLLLYWFGFNQTIDSVDNSSEAKLPNPNWPKRRSVVEVYFPA